MKRPRQRAKGDERIGVLFIEDSVGLAGSTVSLCHLLAQLDYRTYNAYVVFSRPTQQTYWEKRASVPIETVVISPWASLKKTRWARGATRLGGRIHPTAQRLAAWGIAVADILCVTVPYCLRIAWFCRGKRVALIHHNNGFYLSLVLLRQLLGVPVIAYQRGPEWNSPGVRFLVQYIDFFIANSQATKRVLLAIGVRPERIEVVYPAVDLTVSNAGVDCEAQRSEFGFDRSAAIFGIVGRLQDWKGHRVFLEAARKVFEALPGSRALIVGAAARGREDYERELHSFAAELGIADRVVFTGFRNDVPQLMKLLDVVVHASVQPEPFGRVIVEAMAIGKPVIATKGGGPEEIIDDGQTGFLVPSGDADALAARLIQILTDRELAGRIGEQARQSAVDRFSAPRHAHLMQCLYSRVLASARGSGSDGSAASVSDRATSQATSGGMTPKV